MEELVVSAHEFESFSKWYRYREPVVSGCVQGVSSTRNIHMIDFSLEQHGYIGILEAGDTSLQAIGLPASLEQIMPEWVSRLPLEDELYYILYVMADNDCVIQVYLPKTLVAGALEAWLEEQPLEEEEEDEEEMGHAEPF